MRFMPLAQSNRGARRNSRSFDGNFCHHHDLRHAARRLRYARIPRGLHLAARVRRRAAVRRRAGRHKHPTAGCLDSQSVKSSSVPGVRGYDCGKQVKGRKRHLLVDTLGLVLAVVVTAASISDPKGARLLFARLGGSCKKVRRIWVDGTYRGKLLSWVSDHCWFLLEPVLRSDEMKGFVLLKRRWVVERTFAWLTQCRRLGKDYEVLPASSEALISIAVTRLMIRRLAS